MDFINKFYSELVSGETISSVEKTGPAELKDRDLLVLEYLKDCNKVFEIGVGTGFNLSLSNASFKGGIDISKQAVELTKKILLKNNMQEDQMELYQRNIDAKDLSTSSNKYDGVMILETLEHLFDPIHALSESNRILKNNGLLAISIPNIGYFESRFYLFKKGELNDFSGSGKILTEHIRFFGAKSIIKILTISGFKVVRIKGVMKKNINKNYIMAPKHNTSTKNKNKKISKFFIFLTMTNICKLLNKLFSLYKIFPSFFAVGLVIECVKVNEPTYKYNEAISSNTANSERKYQINQTRD